jgi:threonine dehydratase
MDVVPAIIAAERRIRPFVRETPLEYSAFLSALTGAEVLLKLENMQHTGSFKVRGALNALLCLTFAEREHGIVAASSGNHGMAIAFGMRVLGVTGVVFVPEDASPTKVAAIRALGAEVRQHGDDCLVAEVAARRYAIEQGMSYLSPYNDLRVVAGQGTLGVELVRQAEHLDAVFVAVGGGGLISGVASYLKAQWPDVLMVGCQPERSAVMFESLQAGRIVELPDRPTLSDGTAGGIEAGSLTFGLCQQVVDRFVLVSEEEIGAAMRLAIDVQHTLIEGAAGVALAAFLRCAEEFRGMRVAVVLCGANVSAATLKCVL